MGKAQTGRAGLRHVITRVRPDERERDSVPDSQWSEADGRPSPGERRLGAMLAGPGRDPVWVRERTWESHPASVAQARALTWAAIADWNLLELTDEAELCASELATNAVVHATMPDQLT
ncbi:hypothetical protein ACFRCG_29695 [Embleya sp. NPDC056575]|uniref:hypothetical protein n=1 Tax=unclassified Embleya TaxID=2699296 RepID=UPI0036B78223